MTRNQPSVRPAARCPTAEASTRAIARPIAAYAALILECNNLYRSKLSKEARNRPATKNQWIHKNYRVNRCFTNGVQRITVEAGAADRKRWAAVVGSEDPTTANPTLAPFFADPDGIIEGERGTKPMVSRCY